MQHAGRKALLFECITESADLVRFTQRLLNSLHTRHELCHYLL